MKPPPTRNRATAITSFAVGLGLGLAMSMGAPVAVVAEELADATGNTAASAAVSRVRSTPLAAPDTDTRRARMNDETRLVLDRPTHRFDLTIPEDGFLEFGYGARSGLRPKPKHHVQFRVSFESDGQLRQLWQSRVKASSRRAFDRWYDVRVSLAEVAGVRGTLIFEAIGGAGHSAVGALWAVPRILHGSAGQSPNVVLVSLDTLRADHLGIYGHTRETSPNLDAMARDGVVFRRAFATSNWTLPSHASLFTGRYPWRHGARHFGLKNPIPDALATLPEQFSASGYETFGFVGGVFVSADLGFDRGFDRYVDPGYSTFNTVPFAKNLRMTLGLLEHRRDRPFFLFLHTYQIHMPYKPRAPWDRAFSPDYQGPYRKSFTSDDYTPYRWTDALDAETVEHIATLYDGGIRQTDEELGILWRVIRDSPLANDTCIFVTSDHGDEFKEHGNLFHHNAKVFDELIRIPLVAWCPGRFASGHVVEEPVSLVDLLPTLIELSGGNLPDDLDGISLMPALRGGTLPVDRAVLAEVHGSTVEKSGAITAVRTRKHKLVSSTLGGESRVALFDLDADPGEQSDVARRHPQTVRDLSARLDAVRPKGADGDPPTTPDFGADPALHERLRELGYIE